MLIGACAMVVPHWLDPPATVLSMAEWNWASSDDASRAIVPLPLVCGSGGTERLPNPSTQRLSLQDASPL